MVDGTCGPGGLNGYAYNKFGEMGEKWEILGTSLEGYQGLKSLDVKSGNTRGSVNAFHLAGYANGLPFLERPGPLRRIFKQSDSFQGSGFTDDAFGDVISGSPLYEKGVWAFYGQSDFANNYSVPFEDSAYTYGLNSDLTSEFPESTANVFPPPASVVNLFDPTFPATPSEYKWSSLQSKSYNTSGTAFCWIWRIDPIFLHIFQHRGIWRVLIQNFGFSRVRNCIL